MPNVMAALLNIGGALCSTPAATILDREPDKSTRWIKEAVHVRKEG